jgi:hypothetical protein
MAMKEACLFVCLLHWDLSQTMGAWGYYNSPWEKVNFLMFRSAFQELLNFEYFHYYNFNLIKNEILREIGGSAPCFSKTFVIMPTWQSSMRWFSKIWLLKEYGRKNVNILTYFWLPLEPCTKTWKISRFFWILRIYWEMSPNFDKFWLLHCKFFLFFFGIFSQNFGYHKIERNKEKTNKQTTVVTINAHLHRPK